MMHDPVHVEEDDSLKEVMARLAPLGWEYFSLKKLSSTGDRRRPIVVRNGNMGIIALDVFSVWMWLRCRRIICGHSQTPPPPDLNNLVRVLEDRYCAWCSAGHPPRLLEKRL